MRRQAWKHLGLRHFRLRTGDNGRLRFLSRVEQDWHPQVRLTGIGQEANAMNTRAWVILGVIGIAVAGFYVALYSTHLSPAQAPANNPNTAPITRQSPSQ